MNLNYFKTFITVCENGNFTEAAKLLYVPQPTVSNRIRVLEQELGQDLFIKKNKGKRCVELTEAGRTFLPYAKEMIDSLEIIKNKMTLDYTSRQNQFKIATTIPLNHPIVFNNLKSVFSSTCHLKVSNIEHNNLIEEFTKNQIDIAIITVPLEDHQFNCSPLGSEQLHFITSKHHRLSKKSSLEILNQLQDKNIIYLKPFFEQVKLILGQRLNHTNLLETNDVSTIKKLILEGEGIAIVPPGFFSQELNENSMTSTVIEKIMGLQQITYYLVSRQNTIHGEMLG